MDGREKCVLDNTKRQVISVKGFVAHRHNVLFMKVPVISLQLIPQPNRRQTLSFPPFPEADGYLLRPILFRNCRYFTGLCSSNIPRYFLDFALHILRSSEVLRDILLKEWDQSDVDPQKCKKTLR